MASLTHDVFAKVRGHDRSEQHLWLLQHHNELPNQVEETD